MANTEPHLKSINILDFCNSVRNSTRLIAELGVEIMKKFDWIVEVVGGEDGNMALERLQGKEGKDNEMMRQDAERRAVRDNRDIRGSNRVTDEKINQVRVPPTPPAADENAQNNEYRPAIKNVKIKKSNVAEFAAYCAKVPALSHMFMFWLNYNDDIDGFDIELGVLIGYYQEYFSVEERDQIASRILKAYPLAELRDEGFNLRLWKKIIRIVTLQRMFKILILYMKKLECFSAYRIF
ncbi:hypothetical protein WA026_010795 [Henosepilachna vigintioctopunctata]|uniref:Uncharacterized protein n=1 Tax=Henosepilachna vigintioctopunctata TaxID=420089 RepID=A0AAW1UZK2_9CUCU